MAFYDKSKRLPKDDDDIAEGKRIYNAKDIEINENSSDL